MAELSFIGPLAVAGRVQQATGDLSAAASAGGYAAWVRAVTGEDLQVRNLGNNRAKLVLSPAQSVAMQKWLDKQIQPKTVPPTVEYGIGEYLVPWAMKYALPAGIGLFVLGWIAAYYIQR